MSASPQLSRRLGTGDAVVIGAAAMIGAGVFAAFAPAASAAGGWLLLALAIAAVVAFGNATSSAQLAARYPESGGTYVYGRERLGDWWGFAAGWSFVIGKTASCAAMAMTFAAYAVPASWQRPAAALAVVALVALNLAGVERTARVARVLVSLVLLALVGILASGVATLSDAPAQPLFAGDPDPYGILQAAGLLFFAFAGYARLATLGEEVREPRRTIPRAILVALAGVLVLYAVIGVVLLLALGAEGIAATPTPLLELVRASPWPALAPVAQVGAALASLGALLALLAGVSRTSLAMARRRDLPHALARVSGRSTPWVAETVLGVVLVVLVLTVDLRQAIGFSSFGVLLYYFVANVAAYTQTGADRLYPRALQVVGALGCLVLAVTLPVLSVAVGAGVLAIGLAGRALVRRFSGSAA